MIYSVDDIQPPFFPQFLLIYASHITMPSFKSIQLVVLTVFPSLCDSHNQSECPACKSSSCELSKVQTCFHMSSYLSQLMCLSTLSRVHTLYTWSCLSAPYSAILCSVRWYSFFVSSPGCPEASIKAAAIQLDLLRRDSYVSGSFFQESGQS